MADEERERISAQSTSEATPPHAEDSPEMVEQPSTPEDERVSSSTDHQPPEAAAESSPEAEVSSTLEQEPQDDGAGPSYAESQLSVLLLDNEAANPALTPRLSSSGRAPEIENQPAFNEDVAVPEVEPARERVVDERMLGEVLETEDLQAVTQVQHAKEVTNVQIRSLLDVHKPATQRNTEPERFDDFDLHDDLEYVSPGSNSSSENITDEDESSSKLCSRSYTSKDFGLESKSPLTGSGVRGEEKGSVSFGTEGAKLGSDSSAKPGNVIEGESSTTKNVEKSESSSSKVSTATQVSETTAPQNVRKLSDVPPSKTSTATQVSEASAPKNIRVEDHLSPPKISTGTPVSVTGNTKSVGVGSEFIPDEQGTAIAEASGSASDAAKKKLEVSSPKRKLESIYQHLQRKRSSPFTSPEKPSDLHVSTLLGDLDIKEIEDKPESSESVSRQEQVMGMEMGEAEEPQKEGSAQERLAVRVAGEYEKKEAEQVKSMDTGESEVPRWERAAKESSMETVETENSQKEAEKCSSTEMKDESEKESELGSSTEMKDEESEQGSSTEMKDEESEQGSSTEMKDEESEQSSSTEMKDEATENEAEPGSNIEMKDQESQKE